MGEVGSTVHKGGAEIPLCFRVVKKVRLSKMPPGKKRTPFLGDAELLKIAGEN